MVFDGVKIMEMVYGLLGISWVMTGSVREEMEAWKGIGSRSTYADIIPLNFFFGPFERRETRGFLIGG